MRITTKVFGSPAECDWTPMIDMTFQLIAFFMFVLNFGEADQDERIRLPLSELAKPAEVAAERPLTLQLTRQGTVIFAGREMPLVNLKSELRREAEVLDRLKKSPTAVTMIIRADADAETGKVQELIQTCQEAKFEKFSLRAKQKEPGPQR
jgi:biopolymer transport protein ExbD